MYINEMVMPVKYKGIFNNNIWHLHSLFGSYNVYLNDTRIS